MIGLRAIQPDTAVIKVMSIPDNHCIRVVIPDDHVGTNGFHEVLIHDMDEADPPFVALGELGCLRLDWPRAIFSFMGRYQVDLEQLRHECRDHFGSTQSGLCTYYGKFIRQDLGRHVACYHLDLAQLWRWLVSWCTVWQGTLQDCIDHMRKAHSVPATVKAANLVRWFPPWTVSREQCNTILRSSICGVAVDALLFSRIGVPLTHRYRVLSHTGTHVAFRGTYMTKLQNFLNDADAACLRARNRHRTRALASQMSREGLVDTHCREPDKVYQPSTSRRLCSQSRATASVAAVAAGPLTPVIRSLRSGHQAIPALMDLELPRFATEDDSGVDRVYRSQWVVTQQSPASPAPLRSPSLCLNLDTLSSDGSVGPGDISTVPICISDQSSHSGDPDQVLFDDDLPPDNHVDLVSPDSPTVSARMSPDSSPEAPVVRLADSSAPISPNRVRSDCTPNTLEAGLYLRCLRTLRVFC